jgi:DNA-binding response OmpR family regulator
VARALAPPGRRATLNAESSVRILIVEDEVRLRVNLVRVLSRRAFVMEQAATVAEAKKLFAERSYDAVLLDWQLPDGTGLEVCTAIRETNRDVHIIMFTGRADHSDRLRAFDAGVDDYVVKDADIEEIGARLRAVSRRRGNPTTVPA